MTEEELKAKGPENNVSGVTEDTYASMLSEAIKSKDAEIASLKKAQADRVQELTNLVINGSPAETGEETTQEVLPTRMECYKKYKENKFSTDLEYWQNLLDLRDATIREYGKDPFVTGSYGFDVEGHVVDAAYGEAEAMQGMADVIRQTIQDSNGDPTTFTLKMKALIK